VDNPDSERNEKPARLKKEVPRWKNAMGTGAIVIVVGVLEFFEGLDIKGWLFIPQSNLLGFAIILVGMALAGYGLVSHLTNLNRGSDHSET